MNVSREQWIENRFQGFPENWKRVRIKNLFQEIDERSVSGTEELLSLSHYTGVTPRREGLADDDHLTNAKTLVGYKLVRKGDLIVNIMGAWNGRLGISAYDGITSPAYCVYRIKGNINPEYFGYLFRTDFFVSEFLKNSRGVGTGFLRLYSDKFFAIHCVLPEKEEQDNIVDYIKAISEKIAHFVERKERFIELLKEQRQSIITHAVTKGIDPYAKLKPSGVDWLGEVPEHWEVRRLKTVGRTRYGLGQPPRLKEGGLPIIRATNVDAGRILERDLALVDPKDVPWDRNPKLNAGDIIVVRSGALTGDSAIIPPAFDGAIAGYDMVLKTTSGSSDFVAFFLLSRAALHQIELLRQRAAQPHLNKEQLDNVVISWPSLTEQQAIVEFINSEIRLLDITISKAEREIELIKEYRDAMIAETVTGKMNVS